MGVLDRFRSEPSTMTIDDGEEESFTEIKHDLEIALTGERETNIMLKERLYELEVALEDEGWQRLGWEGEREFSRDGLRRIVDLSRIMTLKNPIIGRAVAIRAFYIWGQGVQIKGRAKDVNDEIIQPFLDDIGNRRELFSQNARMKKDKKLATDGNIFFVLDTSYLTGKVNLRSLPMDEVDDIIVNPDDRVDIWYYVRKYQQKFFDRATGRMTSKQKTAYYPDYYYALQRMNDKSRPSQINGKPVIWSQPVLHVKVGELDDMRFGVPETYSSLDWARAYKSYLEDWASLVRAISMFAWKYTTKKNKLKAARDKLQSMTDPEGAKTPAGSAFVQAEGDGDLIPINKSGATTSAGDGRMLRLMVASGMDVPDTMLSNDPQQGALATAKTLDRPTELAMRTRQGVWSDTIKDILQYVIIQHVNAPGAAIKGSFNPQTFKLVVTSSDTETDNPESVDVDFPSIVVPDMKDLVDSIVSAMTLDGKQPANVAPIETFQRLLLGALGVDDVDEVLSKVDGELVTVPQTPAQAEEAMGFFFEGLRKYLEEKKAKA